MIEFEEQKLKLESFSDEVKSLEDALGLEQLQKEIEQLENQTSAEGFWDDQKRSSEILKEISNKKSKVEMAKNIRSQFEDLLTLIEMADEEEDLSMLEEITSGVIEFEKELSSATLETL